MARIKSPNLAGTWYAGDEPQLRRQVDELLSTVELPDETPVALAGLVVPHAGYAYSGRAAAAGYARLRGGPYRRAVILAPSHVAPFRGVAVLDVDFFETPLGLIAVDSRSLAMLLKHRLFRENPAPYQEEHALEIQLPFLQRVLPELRVVPALLGTVTGDDYAAVAAALRELEDDETVFIVSSDFVHYGWRFGYVPFPAEGPEPVRAGLRQLDMGAIERVCAGDAGGFHDYVAQTGATICGRVPIGVFLTLNDRRRRGHLLTYYTSLDVTDDFEHCVSYASIAFPRSGAARLLESGS